MKSGAGFTLIEILIAMAITAMLASSVIITVNPAKKFEDARDMQRQIHLQSILSAIEMRRTMERGWPAPCEDLPQELNTSTQPIFKTIGSKVDPAFYDLYKCLVPVYLNTELFDPLEGSKEDTKYQIWQNPYSKVVTLIYVKDEKKIAAGPEEYQVLSIPTVTTKPVTGVALTTAESGGEVTEEGGSFAFEKGVVWNTSASSTYNDNRTLNGSGIGAFTSYVTNLKEDNTYFLRAYARNEIGIGYGAEQEFRTCGPESTAVKTLGAINVAYNIATIRGEITCLGLEEPYRYFKWGLDPEHYGFPDIPVEAVGKGVFSANLTDLEVDHTYYFMACAENDNGTYCGDQKSFFTAMQTPELTTVDITEVGYNSAVSGGTIINNGGGYITKKGVCWSNYIKEPTTDDDCTDNGSGSDSFVSAITGLSEATIYYIRAYAVNGKGAGYGQLATSTTQGGLCFGIGSGGAPPGADSIPLSCSTRDGACLSSEITVLKMSALDNAHAELPNRHLYNYSVCCTGNMLGTACDGQYATFLKLSGVTNAHVEEGSQTNYGTSVCLSTTYGAGAKPSTIDCVYDTACSGLYTCLASISGYTNAHIGDCNAYPTKVCCANICP